MYTTRSTQRRIHHVLNIDTTNIQNTYTTYNAYTETIRHPQKHQCIQEVYNMYST